LYSISDVDYQRNLCESYFEASDFGTPSPLAYPMVVADRLEHFHKESSSGVSKPRFEGVFDQWGLIIQGLYFDLLEVRSLVLKKVGGLGQLLAQEAGEEAELSLLVFDNEVIGLTDSRVVVVPGVRVSWETFHRLREAVEEKTTQGAKEIFARWARKKAGEQPSLATGLLSLLGRRWSGAEREPLEGGQESLFDPGLSVPVGDQPGDELSPLQLVVYRGTPISCSHCGYEISREAAASAAPYPVMTPADCRCPECLTPQGWLEDHGEWIRYDDDLNRFLIYAVAGSPCLRKDYPVELEFQEDGVILRTGRFAMKVMGQVISEERLKCDRLTFFLDGEREIRPDLPVRGEFFDLVEESSRQTALMGYGKYQCSLRLRGWKDEVKLSYEAEEIHREEALVLIWPDFVLESWSTYFYLVDAGEPMRKAGLGVSLLRKGRKPEVRDGDRGRVNEAFDGLEMVFRGDGSKKPEHAGIYRPGLRPLDRGERPVTLALDFGTSGTALWYRVGDDDPQPLLFEDLTKTVISHEGLAGKILSESRWLPTYQPKGSMGETSEEDSMGSENGAIAEGADGDLVNWFLPSELVMSHERSSQQNWVPIRDFRLLHPRATEPAGEVLFDIKSEAPHGTKDGQYRFSDLVTNYLETVLLLALGSVLKALPHTGYFKLRFSFPRAFSSEKLEIFVKALEATLERVRKATGLSCNEHSFLDEAQAAANAVQARGHASLVLDMGGGTTDVCLFDWKKGVLKPVFQDSLQYGGSDFLRLLVTHRHLFPNPSLAGEKPLLWLIREVRLHGFGAVVRNHYTAEQQAKLQTAKLLIRFFTPIVYFVRRLFDSLEEGELADLAKRPLSVYLMGNGWSLAEGIAAVDKSRGGTYDQVLQRLLTDQRFENVSVLTKPDRVEGWTGPKAAVAYGALKASPKVLMKSTRDANGRGGIRSIVGFDLEIDDGSRNTQEVPWHTPIPLPLDGSDCSPLLSGIELPEEWAEYVDFSKPEVVRRLEEICSQDVEKVGDYRLKRSPLTRFIETIYKDSLGKSGAEQL